MIKYILFIVTFAVFQPFHAAENNSLIVHLRSGAKIAFPVEEKPQITFEGNILCIKTERYQISDVEKYTFSGNKETSMQEIDGKRNGLDFHYLEGEKIAVSVKDPSIAVRIYSSKGIEYPANKVSGGNGSIIIDMAGLMPDVYIIAVGNEVIKIRKR